MKDMARTTPHYYKFHYNNPKHRSYIIFFDTFEEMMRTICNDLDTNPDLIIDEIRTNERAIQLVDISPDNHYTFVDHMLNIVWQY